MEQDKIDKIPLYFKHPDNGRNNEKLKKASLQYIKQFGVEYALDPYSIYYQFYEMFVQREFQPVRFAEIPLLVKDISFGLLVDDEVPAMIERIQWFVEYSELFEINEHWTAFVFSDRAIRMSGAFDRYASNKTAAEAISKRRAE